MLFALWERGLLGFARNDVFAVTRNSMIVHTV